MNKTKKYIRKVLGIDLKTDNLSPEELSLIPYYIRNMFDIYRTCFFDKEVIFMCSGDPRMDIKNIEKQIKIIYDIFQLTIILVLENITSVERIKLIEKKINFIVPGKQLFLPAFLMDLRETYKIPQQPEDKLMPSAQVIILFDILSKNEHIENYSLKKLARKFGYTPMAITKAANNLNYHQICDIKGTKEKYLDIKKNKKELWDDTLEMMVHPVTKRVYIDELPENNQLYKSNESALYVYSGIAEGNQYYFAISRGLFYQLKRNDQLRNENEEEGNYCLEIWKYDPGVLTQSKFVDPLSLYLSLKENKDERIQMALEQILKTYIWSKE